MSEENLFVQEHPEKKTVNFATVAEIYDDGISLIFDGEETPSEKHYKCNSFIVFVKGDRVRIAEDSGSYVVEYPVGNPRKSFEVDYAKTAGTADSAKTAETAKNADKATTATRADTADEADDAKKLNGKSESALSVGYSMYSTHGHKGSNLGFFNNASTYRRSVASVSTSASTTTLANKINELIRALEAYGLLS